MTMEFSKVSELKIQHSKVRYSGQTINILFCDLGDSSFKPSETGSGEHL